MEQDDDNNEATEKKYEEILAERDVSQLSRAQRRARARHIMKQQRRVATTAAIPQQPQAQGDDRAALALVAQQQQADDNDDEHAQHNHHPALSRKERQRLAKAAEREERKLLQEERQQQQEMAQKQAKQRKLQRLQQQTRQAQEEKISAKMAQKEAWETFLCNETGAKLLVTDWLKQCRQNRLISCHALATEFGVSLEHVRQRIQQLVQEQRVAGVFTKENMFVFFDEKELRLLADSVRTNGCMDAGDISKWMNNQVSRHVV